MIVKVGVSELHGLVSSVPPVRRDLPTTQGWILSYCLLSEVSAQGTSSLAFHSLVSLQRSLGQELYLTLICLLFLALGVAHCSAINEIKCGRINSTCLKDR